MKWWSSKRLTASVVALATGGALVLAVGSPGPARAADVGEDIVTNGTFETESAPWQGRAGASVERTEDEAATGTGSLRVSGRTSSVSGTIQRLPVEAGATYDVSFKVKYTDTASSTPVTFNGTVDYGSSEGGSQYVILVSGSVPRGEWTEVSGEVVVPTGRSLADYQFYIENNYGLPAGAYPTSFYVDDVSFVMTEEGDGTDPEPVADPLERNDNTAAGSFGAFAKTPGTDEASRRGNPLVTQNFGADPWAMEVDGRVYVYSTNDTQEWPEYLQTGQDNNYGAINQINVWSSADLMNWTNHGPINAAGPDGITSEAQNRPNNSWAPAAAAKDVDGDGEDEFFLYFANSAGGIWVLQGDSPTGPFTSPLDRSLIGFDTPGVRNNSNPEANDVVWLFDPAVLVDDDGQAYIYFGGGLPEGEANYPNTARMAKLGDDMISLADDDEDGTVDEAQMIDAPGIFEDSGIHKFGDKYYYTYCTNFSHNLDSTEGREFGRGDIVVMESDSPLGPWSEPELVFPNQNRFFGVGGNNHHAFFTFQDQWYLTYHAMTLDLAIQGAGNTAGFRNAHIDPVEIAEDGTITDVVGTYAGPGQQSAFDPYGGPVSAETIAWQAGTRQGFVGSSDWEGQTPTPKLTSVHDGDWTSLAGADFGTGAGSITAKVLPKAGGTITVSTSPDPADAAAVVGELTVPAGDGEEWTNVSTDLAPGALSGEHDLFFRYAGEGDGELFDVETWTFTEGVDEPGPPAETSVVVPRVRMTYGRPASMRVHVRGADSGVVSAVVGGRTVQRRVDSSGRATLVLPARSLPPGDRPVRVRYLGTPEFAPSSTVARVSVSRARSRVMTAAFRAVERARWYVVRVRVAATGVQPAGKVRLGVAGIGADPVTGALRDGRVTLRVRVAPNASLGAKRVRVTYLGNRYVAPRAVFRTVRIVR